MSRRADIRSSIKGINRTKSKLGVRRSENVNRKMIPKAIALNLSRKKTLRAI